MYHIANILKLLNIKNLQFFCIWIEKKTSQLHFFCMEIQNYSIWIAEWTLSNVASKYKKIVNKLEQRDKKHKTCTNKYKLAWKFAIVYFCGYELSNDDSQKWNFSSQKWSKFQILSYRSVIYLKRKLRTYTIKIQPEKVRFLAKK